MSSINRLVLLPTEILLIVVDNLDVGEVPNLLVSMFPEAAWRGTFNNLNIRPVEHAAMVRMSLSGILPSITSAPPVNGLPVEVWSMIGLYLNADE